MNYCQVMLVRGMCGNHRLSLMNSSYDSSRSSLHFLMIVRSILISLGSSKRDDPSRNCSLILALADPRSVNACRIRLGDTTGILQTPADP